MSNDKFHRVFYVWIVLLKIKYYSKYLIEVYKYYLLDISVVFQAYHMVYQLHFLLARI